MEHEVFVPVPVGRLREALSDPERVARAVPGLQQDVGTPPVAGRVKVRVAGHTITYRGTLRVTAQDDGSYAVEGDATEARGTGAVNLTLTLRLTPATEGTTLTCTGTATADGRITELPADSVSSAVTRLLGRFAENLGKTAETEPKPTAGSEAPEADASEADAPEAEASGSEAREAVGAADADVASESAESPEAADEQGEAADEQGREEGEPPAPVEDEPPASVFEAEVPPSALDPFAEEDFVAGGEPPAEAAHARRTMIGRSAEEVDHAPPRGRYAPVPAPEPVSASATLRWAAPAAALAVASAIIVTRALRKRR
ncbi:SRPBCC family protein [Streptomyces europaeiscabiei]|uniref:SRPBCC family protein n=1 Tax=Streptomyces europaeiscabiei TaxID=146819 RepID=UPI0029A607A7|nr:SRPBCC family protein [Streptomyces europaeiscabiei]MDX3708914.1 SRPBCC family protein [Streptomyces europaeiscabiei]MDX3830960.1 SRPBCC family protein [Streptomyces europaeiscabiei]MDX3864487.1 SRPBCC family protein [Streptomyces europaeiscabiei]MDX3871431.1 SRPBCC family protein [Streptomyces europaeiscabiei]